MLEEFLVYLGILELITTKTTSHENRKSTLKNIKPICVCAHIREVLAHGTFAVGQHLTVADVTDK